MKNSKKLKAELKLGIVLLDTLLNSVVTKFFLMIDYVVKLRSCIPKNYTPIDVSARAEAALKMSIIERIYGVTINSIRSALWKC